jgi:thiol-disulfide isomerase/thioredoxin
MYGMRVARVAAGLMFVVLLAAPAVASEGDELLGRPAAEWEVTHWINSPPLRLADLRGKVVLVRWWTAPDCPFCAASAPTLNELDRRYGGQGLVVVGLYHHKEESPLDTAAVERYARGFGFRFPLAIDVDWKTLRRWWLDTGNRGWTSVSFLIDRGGIVRYVHPGGQYAPGEPDARQLEATLVDLLNRSPGEAR